MARWTVIFAVLTGLIVAVWIYHAGSSPPEDDGWTMSASGPVSPHDKAMLYAVRQATLWEIPALQQTELAGASPGVRNLGQDLSGNLSELSEQVQVVSARLGVELPAQATAQQQQWIGDMAGDSGEHYDRQMVGYLYRSCETTLTIVTTAQVETRNPEIRALADYTVPLLRTHLRYLTATGLLR
jgi:predicted outer membrane protein